MGRYLDIVRQHQNDRPERRALDAAILSSQVDPELSPDMIELCLRASRIKKRDPKWLSARERRILIELGRSILDFAHPARAK